MISQKETVNKNMIQRKSCSDFVLHFSVSESQNIQNFEVIFYEFNCLKVVSIWKID